MSEIEIINVEPQLVVGLQRIGAYGIMAQMIPEAFEFVMKNGAKCIGAPISVCHETAETVCEANKNGTAKVDVNIPVDKEIADEGAFKCYTLEGGKFAKILHKGPYQECSTAYEKLFKWVADNGKKLTGPTREIYLNDPREVKESEIETNILAPIE